MPITFSEEFHISQSVLATTHVFDVILDVDTRVFIDSALLELCREPEFINSRSTVETYFSNIITLLHHSKRDGDMYWRGAEHLLTFRELTGTCFGYSNVGTGGNGIGSVLRNMVIPLNQPEEKEQ